MNILSIDTSTKTGSVAILYKKGDSPHSEGGLSPFSENLIPVIDRTLCKAGLKLSDIDAFAVAIGPGSFTGLRIGVATAKGLAFALGKPIVGISSLEALALNPPHPPFDKGGRGGILIIPCINAYRGEVYTSVVSGQWSVASKKYLLPECSINPEALCEILCRGGAEPRRMAGPSPPEKGARRGAPLLFIGDGAIQYKELFKEKLGERFILAKAENFPIAENVGRLALERLKKGETDEISTLAPNYIRRPDAELKKVE